VLEVVVNISEGRDLPMLESWASKLGSACLDLHTDHDHHRSVFTLVGEFAPRVLARLACEHLDLGRHRGAHPRIGVVDVVPFVPLGGSTLADAVAARDRFARWAWRELAVPSFLYGPERTLPDIRRHAFVDLAPDVGTPPAHPSAGAMAVGARGVLVAYNLWLDRNDLALARTIASSVRSAAVRTLGLQVGASVQVSCNLIDPNRVGPAQVYDDVAAKAEQHGAEIERAELVGLLPRVVLDRIDSARWTELDLSPERTIEGRLRSR
jgi:glutamate formiminotransferase/glutamate formiminotransferase/formiminotetrahydrofolate cyclodeaminase